MLQITGVATHLNARFIASLVGKIISMGLALGPMSRIMTRSCTSCCGPDMHGVST